MKTIIGVMGPGSSATSQQCSLAYAIGFAIAMRGHILLSGGMSGTMAHACAGAKAGGGLVIGVCPTDDAAALCPDVDIPIVTAMKSGRNFINILSSERVIAIGARSAGTLSEVAFAIHRSRPLLIVGGTPEMRAFLDQVEGGENIQYSQGLEGLAPFLT